MILSTAAALMEADELKAALTETLSLIAKIASGSASRVCRAMTMTGWPSQNRGRITEKGTHNQRAMRANNSDLIVRLYSRGNGVIDV